MKGLVQRRRDGEAGFTMVEIIAAIGILSIGFIALTGAFAASTRVLVQSKQRQAATEQANGALEHIRNIPYDQVALQSAPGHSSDPKNPDFYVNVAGTGYDHAHNGAYEDIATGGAVAHIDGPTVVGSTSLTSYDYVTWVDDPVGGSTAHDYKRLTVVEVFSSSANPGRKSTLQVSAFLTKDSVSVGGTSTTPQQGSTPTASPSATPSPTPTGPCPGDSTPPTGTLTILSGTGAATGYTNSTTAQVKVGPSDPCTPIQAQLSNDNVTYGTWFTYGPSAQVVSWILTTGDGTKRVWAHYQDGQGNIATIGPQSIVLDTLKPTVPGTLGRTVSCAGSDRTVSLSWGSSSDTNFLGYRVYKQVNGGGWTLLATTAQLSAQNTDQKSYDSVQYEVTAYDKAGNEGNPTNVVTLSKNQCS
ncbi:MAG: hypothetical protein ABR552_00990 [Actinomycetota bacterium]